MNARLHLMQRIRFIMPYITSEKMRSVLEQAHRVAAADEDEISDLVSQVDVLERQLARFPAYAFTPFDDAMGYEVIDETDDDGDDQIED